MMLSGPTLGRKSFYHSFEGTRYLPYLEQVKCPRLILFGGQSTAKFRIFVLVN